MWTVRPEAREIDKDCEQPCQLPLYGGLCTHSSKVGRASHSVVPRNAVLTRKMAAIFNVAFNNNRRDDGCEGGAVPYERSEEREEEMDSLL